MVHRASKNSFVGKWRITEMSSWNKEYFDEEVPAYIKRGAPFNHRGTTKLKIDTKNVCPICGTEYPGCQSKQFKVIGQKSQQQEEIPPDIQPEAVNIIRDICQYKKCHLKFLARDNQTPL